MKNILVLLTLVVSTSAFPACYMIYGPSNDLVWAGPRPPVPMDTLSINDEVQIIVPQGHMVIVFNVSLDAGACYGITPTEMQKKPEKGKPAEGSSS